MPYSGKSSTRAAEIRGFSVKDPENVLSKNILQNDYAKTIVPRFGAKGLTWMRVSDGKASVQYCSVFQHPGTGGTDEPF
jgi:hypothetical protein